MYKTEIIGGVTSVLVGHRTVGAAVVVAAGGSGVNGCDGVGGGAGVGGSVGLDGGIAWCGTCI